MNLRLRRVWAHIAALLAISAAFFVSLSPAVQADVAEPVVLGRAWYWEDYQQEEINTPAGRVVVETTNPFCPTLPGQLGGVPKTCAEGRLPIEIRAGDYQKQNKFSAVAFDFALVPLGSQIQKFQVTFLEAKSGCYDAQGKENTQDCNEEQTSQFNAEDKTLQACLLMEFFGDGEGRPVKEAPKYDCSAGDPTATRKAVKSKKPSEQGPNADHVWTFDLTTYAQRWVDNPPEMAGIVIRAAKPKGDEPTDSNWRVVLAGPSFPDGIVTQLKYDPPTTVLPTGGGGSNDGSSGSFTTTIPGTPGTPGTPAIPGTPSTAPGAPTTAPVDTSPSPSTSPVSASDLIEDEPNRMPGYFWLGLLAGLVGFSLVRQLVLERATGIRPDGVLAQIKALTAGSGAAAVARRSGPLAALGSGAAAAGRGVRSGVSTVVAKLPFGKKG